VAISWQWSLTSILDHFHIILEKCHQSQFDNNNNDNIDNSFENKMYSLNHNKIKYNSTFFGGKHFHFYIHT